MIISHISDHDIHPMMLHAPLIRVAQRTKETQNDDDESETTSKAETRKKLRD